MSRFVQEIKTETQKIPDLADVSDLATWYSFGKARIWNGAF